MLYPQRAALIRRLGRVPDNVSFGPPEDRLVRALVTSRTPTLLALDREAGRGRARRSVASSAVPLPSWPGLTRPSGCHGTRLPRRQMAGSSPAMTGKGEAIAGKGEAIAGKGEAIAGKGEAR